MRKAEFWEKAEEKVRCLLCPHRCLLNEGQLGICNARMAAGGELKTLVYGMTMALNTDPIEKKPLYHFLPGSRSLSVATAGCNLHCTFCQNWTLSQFARLDKEREAGDYITPEALVATVRKYNCKSIAYTYSEPTIFFEYARDTSELATLKGISNIFVTNGFIEQEPLLSLKNFLHAANVDLKFFRDETYRRITGGRLQPVLDTLITMKRKIDVWVEVTTLVIPTLNDSDEELREIAGFIRENLGEETPWHVSRFHPDYQMTNLPPTPHATLFKAREIGMEEGLHYVYTGNIPGDPGETTYCPSCTTAIIRRQGFQVKKNSLREGCCPECGTEIAGIWTRENG